MCLLSSVVEVVAVAVAMMVVMLAMAPLVVQMGQHQPPLTTTLKAHENNDLASSKNAMSNSSVLILYGRGGR